MLKNTQQPAENDDLLARMAARLYKKDLNRKKPEARFKLNDVPTSTPGNLTTYSAASKAGKTAATGALVASTFALPGSDCLGFTSSNPNGYAVIVFDTEQSTYDHAELYERNVCRAKVTDAPPWVLSYCLTGFNAFDIRCAIRCVMEDAKKKFGGIHSFILDGVADACEDVNNAAEANDLIAELHGLAIEFDCVLICIIHVNPGSKAHKTRGHLGSQLERKSECNFKLERTNETTVIFAEKNRRAPIPKDKGACFAWSDQAGMHMSVERPENAADRKEHAELVALAEGIFKEGKPKKYGDLRTAIKEATRVLERAAEKKISRMAELKIITKNEAGHYEKAT